MGRIKQALSWLKRHVFSMHPHVPRSDIELLGFLIGAAFTIVIGYGFWLETQGGKVVPSSLALAFLFGQGIYSAHTITLYPVKLEISAKQRYIRKKNRVTVWRYGEIFGFGLVIYIVMLSLLYVLDIIPVFPNEGLSIVAGVIGILTGTSLFKQILNDEPRIRHNNLFLITALTVVIVQVVALAIEESGGRALPEQLWQMYLAIFLAHIAHDRTLEIRCPDECEDKGWKKWSDYIGAIMLVASIILIGVYFASENAILPQKLPDIFISTLGIMIVAEFLKDRTIKFLQNRRENEKKQNTPLNSDNS